MIIKKPNNRGVALIVAVVTTVIFLMLVMAVVVVSISTYKKSDQSHDRAIALNLAEAGINDALYQMNYRYYADPQGIYPTDLQYLNPNFIPVTHPPMWQTSPIPLPNDPFGVGTGNGYIVQFFAGGLNLDELRSTGIYNGKRRVVSINIRGTNSAGALNSQNQGIAEAFNKHVIYATTVTVIGSGTTVNGNIVYATLPAPLPTGGLGTRTFIDPVINPTLFRVPDFTAFTSLPVSTHTYTDGVNFTTDFGPGSNYSAGIYTFPAIIPLSLSNANFEFTDGPVDGVPKVDISALAAINNSIKTSGVLILSHSPITTIGNGIVFQPAGGITVNPGVITINGDLIVAGTSPVILNNVTVNGNVICDNDITLGSSAGVNGLLYTSSTSITAATIGNTTTNDVTISGTVVASGTVTLNLCTLTWDKSPFLSNTTPNVYEGFSSGRRIYLPVPGSWREE